MGGASIGTSAIASANGTVTATGGDGTAVDSDGTQGDFTNSVQGTADDDGYQDARLITSEDAKPQISGRQVAGIVANSHRPGTTRVVVAPPE